MASGAYRQRGNTGRVSTPFGWRDPDGGFASHSALIVSIDRPDVSIAWGLQAGDRFTVESLGFADPSVLPTTADVRFHGALIHREDLWLVDGARCWLPAPCPEFDYDEHGRASQVGESVSRWKADFARLLDSQANHHSEFDRYLTQCGWTVVSGHPLDGD